MCDLKILVVIVLYAKAALKRYEAAGWLRKMVGVVLGKDLPAEPSEEDFRIGLRSGIILCTVLNKIQPASVPKVCLISLYIILIIRILLLIVNWYGLGS